MFFFEGSGAPRDLPPPPTPPPPDPAGPSTGTTRFPAFVPAVDRLTYRHRIVRTDDEVRYVGCSGVKTRRVSPAEALRSEEHTSELQSRPSLPCPILLVKKTTASAPT